MGGWTALSGYMDTRSIAIIAAFDTKGVEARFLEDIIRQRGHRTLTIDVGVLSDPQVQTDITAREVALQGGAELETLRRSGDKAKAMEVMTRGAAVVAASLYAARRFDAIMGLGGTAGTAIGSSAMRALPIGVPKVLVSTIAAGDTRPYVGTKDITMMPSVVDIAGLNRISTRVLGNAAGAVIGMVETELPSRQERPLIAASMFGNTTLCVNRARKDLEVAGFEVLVFHATGAGGMIMESLIADGHVDGVLDVTTTEWADELCGGVFSAGSRRLDAAALAGIPQVVAPGCLDMVNFWAPETVPAKYAKRQLYRWNPNTTLMRTNVAENQELGRILAEKINQSTGPVTVFLPGGGLSQLDSVGAAFWCPEADQALFASIRKHLRTDIPVVELTANINDPEFADRAAQALLEMMKMRTPGVSLQSLA
ncbi:MAG: Tm-1-like ATP-binding domain-containing protein [Candidatus Sulfotelmatobacter sp.]